MVIMMCARFDNGDKRLGVWHCFDGYIITNISEECYLLFRFEVVQEA